MWNKSKQQGKNCVHKCKYDILLCTLKHILVSGNKQIKLII